MDNAKPHWKILQKLGNDLANRVRSFLVIGKKGEGVIVVTESGEGFWLGKMEFASRVTKFATKPTPLDVPGVIHMTKSVTHILLLNNRGQIYAMGKNNWGQLGLGTFDKKTHFTPKLIDSPLKFTSIRCGYEHSLALTEDGKVYAWGFNDLGQVGLHSSTAFIPSPRQISVLDPYRVVAVECGGHHSLALTDQGEIYFWGSIDSRLCSQLSRHTPTQILSPSPFRSMSSGYVHTLLLTRTGEVYACGWNRRGQLGLPKNTIFSTKLIKVAGLPFISQIASYYELSISMSSDHRYFVWGYLWDGTITFTPVELPPIYSTVDSSLCFFFLHSSTPHSVTISEIPPSPLSARMSRMFDNPETSPDVQFVVEQRTIHAHRIILNNFSDYFAQMFSERWLAPVDPEDRIVRVTIPDYSYQVFHAFLRFLYTDSLKVHLDFLSELFELASQYLETNLQQLCISRMRITITPTTCCLYYPLTVRYSLPELFALQQEVVQFASTNFHELIATDAYQSMDAKLCKKLTLSMANNFP